MASAAAAELIIYAPGLLGPFSGQQHLQTSDWPVLPLLEKMLSRAERVKKNSPIQSDEANFFEFFNLDTSHTDLPLAALSLLAEGGTPGTDCWMRLDPVCLQADRVDAVLIAHEELSLSDAEADALIDSIRPFLEEWSMEIHRTTAHHWYLRLHESMELSTIPLHQAKGQAITQYMPTGQEHLKWHRLMNEVQMLWHSHPVNQQRELQGLMQVNSVWPWGCGVLPHKAMPELNCIYSDDVVVQGLAKLHTITRCELNSFLQSEVQEKQLLVDLFWRELQQQQDVTAWFDALHQWESTVLSRINQILRQNKNLRVIFDLADGYQYKVTHKTMRRWWRRTKSLQQLLSKTE